VAGVAIEPFMTSVQLELGARIVIEVPDLPVACVVAGMALCAQFAPVRVVFLVAGIAGCRRLVLIEMSFMARVAFGQEVTPSQWIFCV